MIRASSMLNITDGLINLQLGPDDAALLVRALEVAQTTYLDMEAYADDAALDSFITTLSLAGAVALFQIDSVAMVNRSVATHHANLFSKDSDVPAAFADLDFGGGDDA